MGATKQQILSKLLPSGSGAQGLSLVFFYDQSDRAAAELDRFRAIDTFKEVEKIEVKITDECEVCSWFGMEEGPCMTLISEGQLLDVGIEITPEAVEQAVEAARRKQVRQG